MAAVACVLLIVCANVANLLLARASHRTREMAIRAAVGANRRRLIRQCLVESTLLSLLGGLSGVTLALALVALLRHFGPANLTRLQDVRLHPIALAFTLAVSLATSVIFGFFPAWRMSQISPQTCMKESSTGPARATHRLQMRLVTGEIAATLVLVIGGSLMVKSFVRVLNVPFGFDPDGVVVVRTLFDRPRYPEPSKREAVQRELLDNLAHLPGVTSVACASHLPLSDVRQIGFRLENAAPGDFHWAENSLVSPGYFRAMGVTVLRGRDFNYDDGRNTPPAALVNEAFARRFLSGRDPIGQRFHWGDRNLFTIIGVVNNVRISALDADPPPMIYDSMFQVESGASSRTAFIIRLSHGGSEAAQGIFNAVQQQIWAADKDLPAYDTTTLETLVSESVSQRRFTTLLMGTFAAIALLLAAIGLFGVVSYLVSERRRELAVRMALGANRGTIAWMILREGAMLTLSGCIAGLAAFAAGSKLLQSSLDPLTMASASSVLILVALLACYWPARRAMLSDPMVALRYE